MLPFPFPLYHIPLSCFPPSLLTSLRVVSACGCLVVDLVCLYCDPHLSALNLALWTFWPRILYVVPQRQWTWQGFQLVFILLFLCTIFIIFCIFITTVITFTCYLYWFFYFCAPLHPALPNQTHTDLWSSSASSLLWVYLTRGVSITISMNWALLQKLPVVQLLKNFLTFHRTWRFITVFTRVLHWCLSWAGSIQSIPPHPISLRSILISFEPWVYLLWPSVAHSGPESSCLSLPPPQTSECDELPLSPIILSRDFPFQFWKERPLLLSDLLGWAVCCLPPTGKLGQKILMVGFPQNCVSVILQPMRARPLPVTTSYVSLFVFSKLRRGLKLKDYFELFYLRVSFESMLPFVIKFCLFHAGNLYLSLSLGTQSN
jgi:hypothetical protein